MPKRRKPTKHHLTPQCHFKPDYVPIVNSASNILRLHLEKHNAWHFVFREASIEQAIALLQRVRRMKRRDQMLRRHRTAIFLGALLGWILAELTACYLKGSTPW